MSSCLTSDIRMSNLPKDTNVEHYKVFDVRSSNDERHLNVKLFTDVRHLYVNTSQNCQRRQRLQ